MNKMPTANSTFSGSSFTMNRQNVLGSERKSIIPYGGSQTGSTVYLNFWEEEKDLEGKCRIGDVGRGKQEIGRGKEGWGGSGVEGEG